MRNNTNHNRWQSLFYMFVALATGNFSYKIVRSKANDELEALVALSNMLSEELQEIFKHHGFVNPRRTYRYLSKMDLFLDKDFKIVDFTVEAPEFFRLPATKMIKRPLRELLAPHSIQVWEEMKPQLRDARFQKFSLELDFLTGEDLLMSTNCFLSSLYSAREGTAFVLSSFLPLLLNDSPPTPNLKFEIEQKEKYQSPKIFSHQSDVRQAHKVRDYLLQNLGKEIPDMKELARIFYTNESKLKNDFKAVFGTTPFQFIKAERLGLAKELIHNTSLPLKDISHTCGFQNYPHFSYAFKEEFGISPQEFRKTPEK